MKHAIIPLLMTTMLASACFAQDEDSFVQHVKSPEEVQYDNWLREKAQSSEKAGQEGSEDPGIDAFAKSYFYAYRNGDLGALRMLATPDSQRCVDTQTSDYFKDELNHSSHMGNIDTLKWRFADEDAGDSARPDNLKQTPEKSIVISWKEGQSEYAATTSHTVYLVESGGEYRQELACGRQGRNSGNNSDNNPFGANSLFGAPQLNGDSQPAGGQWQR